MTALAKAIRMQGRSQSWLARQIGISRSHFGRKVSGERKFKPSEIVELAKITGLPPEMFEHVEGDTRR